MKHFGMRLVLVLASVVCGVSSLWAEVWKEVYTGTIAGKTVRVTLYIDDDNYNVWGTYCYYDAQGKKVSADLNIKGSCNPIGPARNIFELTESYQGKKTGSWVANWNVETDRMTGTMTNSKGKSYKIELRHVN